MYSFKNEQLNGIADLSYHVYPRGFQRITANVNVMKSPYYYIQPNDIIYIQPIKQKSWGLGTSGAQSVTTILSIVSLVATTVLLISR